MSTTTTIPNTVNKHTLYFEPDATSGVGTECMKDSSTVALPWTLDTTRYFPPLPAAAAISLIQHRHVSTTSHTSVTLILAKYLARFGKSVNFAPHRSTLSKCGMTATSA